MIIRNYFVYPVKQNILLDSFAQSFSIKYFICLSSHLVSDQQFNLVVIMRIILDIDTIFS